MEFRVFLKGKEQSGATALLIRALSDLRVISGGWALVELEGGKMGLVHRRHAVDRHHLFASLDSLQQGSKFRQLI